MDFFIVPTIGFKLLYCLVILDHAHRRIVHFAVTTTPNATWVSRQITEAFPWETGPTYLIHDRDPVFKGEVPKRLTAMGIRDRPTAPRSPWQNGYVERLIGSIRRECMDHMIIFDADHLHRIMKFYVDYYNKVRPHLRLQKDAPIQRAIQRHGEIRTIRHLGGLHHQYVRI